MENYTSPYSPTNSQAVNKRLTESQKSENDFQWYKDCINHYDIFYSYGPNNPYISKDGIYNQVFQRKIKNYNLMNNIIDLKDFMYVIKPIQSNIKNEDGSSRSAFDDLPSNFTNKDIISTLIKTFVGMEEKIPFIWQVIATNKEAIDRKQQKKYELIQQYVIEQIMQPIRQKLLFQQQQQQQEQQLNEQQKLQQQQQLQQQLDAMTPEEVERYISRDFKDQCEILANEILSFLFKELDIKNKHSEALYHGCVSAEEIGYVDIVNGKPIYEVVNPIGFMCDRTINTRYIHELDWCEYERIMTKTDCIMKFNSVLTDEELDQINNENAFDHPFVSIASYNSANFIRVAHVVWTSLRRIGFLTTIDLETGQEIETIVGDNYKKSSYDIKIEWKWLPWTYEGYKIGRDIYKFCRPIQGQAVDINNVYTKKFPYIGVFWDSVNSVPTSLVDRAKYYQYMYTIIWYRLENLLASDKGKLLMMNIDLIPKGYDVDKWLYYQDVMNIGFYSNKTEGQLSPNENGRNSIFEVNRSIANDIKFYIDFLEYLRKQCGRTIGLPDEVLGQIMASQAVGNTKQTIVQSSYTLNPYFQLHNNYKKLILERLLELAKICYSENPEKLQYILDDLSIKFLEINKDLLEDNTFGLFVVNERRIEEINQYIGSWVQAAMQNQTIDLATAIKVISSENIQKNIELIEQAEAKKQKIAQQQQQIQQQMQQEAQVHAEQMLDKQHQYELEKIQLTKQLEHDTQIEKATIQAVGFDTEKDKNQNDIPDVLEIAKHEFNVGNKNKELSLKERQQNLEEKKFNHQISESEKQRELKNKELEMKKNQIKKQVSNSNKN